MENNGTVAQMPQKQTAITLLNSDNVKQKFKELLGAKSNGFLTSVLSAVNSNKLLKNATPESVYMAAMMAAALDLPINSNLGFAYIIPYKSKDAEGRWVDVAQFQLGYKGFLQLAQRSGQYRTISAAPVYEGQLKATDPLKGFEFDWNNKKSDKLIGYAGYFELVNGFQKSLFMTVEDLNRHGARYSKTFSQDSSKWKTDFEAMAMKTVIKLLISKYGPLSVDVQMQKAVVADQAVIHDAETMDVEYTDAPAPQITQGNPEQEDENKALSRLMELMNKAKTVEKLNSYGGEFKNFSESEQKQLQELMLDLSEKLENK